MSSTNSPDEQQDAAALGPASSFQNHVLRFADRADAIATAVLGPAGTLQYASSGMRRLLGSGDGLEWMRAPKLDDLLAERRDGEVVYEGLFVFDDGKNESRSLRGRVVADDGLRLILLEVDVAELERVNAEIADLNNEIVGLQRELMTERRELRRTNGRLNKTLDELQQTQSMLIQSEKMNALGQLVAGVAHEINNPIAFVAGNIHSLTDSLADLIDGFKAMEALARQADEEVGASRRADAAAKVHEASDIDFLEEDLDDLLAASTDGLSRVKTIVEDLRVFSRLDEAETQDADVVAGLRSTIALARPKLNAAKVTLTVETPESAVLSCNPAELNQVFLNILINASQAVEAHRETDRRIDVGVDDTGDEVVVAFADNGPGIPADVLGRIFDPFFTTKPVGEGTGLGLSIVHKIITDHHRGRVEVSARPAGGTEFRLHLPRRDDA